MSTHPPSIFYDLKRANLSMRSAADDVLGTLGVSVAQFGAMRRLEDEPGLSGAELARRCFVTPATMAGVVASLEEQHLIERLADPRGGRGLLARLTPAGEEIVERGRALLVWLEDELLSSLSGSARAEFQEALRRCAEAAESFRRPRGSVIPDHLEESAVR